MISNMRGLLLLSFLGMVISQYLTPPHSYDTSRYQIADSTPQETIDPAGNIQGQFNYIDPQGKSIDVQYLTAKDGFKLFKSNNYQPSYRQYNTYPTEQFGQGLQAYQTQNIQQGEKYQPKFTQTLFSPAAEPYPAHTAGQIQSMQEYLEEEKKDLAKEMRSNGYGAQAHVSVKSPNQEYSYKINF